MKNEKKSKRTIGTTSMLGGDDAVMKKPLEIIAVADPKTDPNGSWTGVPSNPYDKPIQDADDL